MTAPIRHEIAIEDFDTDTIMELTECSESHSDSYIIEVSSKAKNVSIVMEDLRDLCWDVTVENSMSGETIIIKMER